MPQIRGTGERAVRIFYSKRVIENSGFREQIARSTSSLILDRLKAQGNSEGLGVAVKVFHEIDEDALSEGHLGKSTQTFIENRQRELHQQLNDARLLFSRRSQVAILIAETDFVDTVVSAILSNTININQRSNSFIANYIQYVLFSEYQPLLLFQNMQDEVKGRIKSAVDSLLELTPKTLGSAAKQEFQGVINS